MSANKLKLGEREIAGAVVIDVAGELTVASGTEQLLDRVRKNIEASKRQVVINMAECRRVDSSGLGELVTCLVTCTRHDTRLQLASVPQQIRGLMKMANIHKVFEIFETEQAALEQNG